MPSDPDRLQRGKFVDDLSKVIVSLPSELTGSFTIGLNGSWGEGKTSVINLLIKKLESDNVVIIQFDPWYYGGEAAILNAFYDQLEKAFSTKFIFPDIKKSIARYLRIISTGVSFSGFKFDIHSPILSIEKTKEQIENYIQKTGKKVLIIIDDIDRLQPDEMALVFKLVRKNTNFKNTIFLLIFDESLVKKTLEEKIGIDRNFLDKIINLPIPLPIFEKERISEFLREKIKDLITREKILASDIEIESLLEKFQNIHKSSELSVLFKTLRLAKRYLNSLYTTLPSIKSEVNPIDYTILEIIKVFEKGMYKKIAENQDIFAPPALAQLSLAFVERSNRTKNILDGMASTPDGYAFLFEGIGVEQKNTFEMLLKSLFPWTYGRKSSGQNFDFSNIGKNRDEKRISHPDCFPKYFLLQAPLLEISDEEIEKMISDWKSLPSEKQKAFIENEMFKTDPKGWASKLMEKLMDFNEWIDSPYLARSLIEVIYENADVFPRGQNSLDLTSSEFSKAASFMVFLIKSKVEKQSIAEVLEDALMKTPDLLFSSFIIEIWKKESFQGEPISDNNSIDLKSFQDKVAQRLKEYFVDNKIDIFEKYVPGWFFILDRWGTHWGEHSGQFNEIIQNYVLSLVKDNAQRLYELFNEMPGMPSFPKIKFEYFKNYLNVTKFREIALKFKDSDILSPGKKDLINYFLGSFPDEPQLSQE
ncbi:MAG: NTPase protein [Acidobacteriota bacterium]|nr:NTPase protein [Acidobacteriota bacterium]